MRKMDQEEKPLEDRLREIQTRASNVGDESVKEELQREISELKAAYEGEVADYKTKLDAATGKTQEITEKLERSESENARLRRENVAYKRIAEVYPGKQPHKT